MKKPLIIVITVLLVSHIISAQNLFLIGERSFLSTNAISLVSNSYEHSGLDLFFGKDKTSQVLGVSTISNDEEKIVGKLIVYLEDGSVLTFNESQATENVDNKAKALFKLTAEQLIKLKQSNIHTVKYTISLYGYKDYSASNNGIKTKDLISEFYKE